MKVEGSDLIDIVIDIGDFELCCDGDLVESKDRSDLVCLCSPHLVEVTLSLKANDQSNDHESEHATRMCLQCISVDGTELLADQLVSISPAFNQYQHCALNLLCNYPELAQQWAADQIINITLRGSA